ncbi:MAG TPA: two-component regulator propeller domain-containing protein, partial [Niabella sp.]
MMKREGVLKLLLFFCLQISNFIHAQSVPDYTKNRYFRTISIDQGLSQSTVFAIQQDRLGFIWVGTPDGLNRYDGKTFTVYRPAKEDSNSLISGYIRSLFVDARGMLWIGGNKGVST